MKPRGVPHGFYKAGTGMVRVMEILTPGESFEGYVNGYEALASRSTSDDEHKEARSELGKLRYDLARRNGSRGNSLLQYRCLKWR